MMSVGEGALYMLEKTVSEAAIFTAPKLLASCSNIALPGTKR